MKLRKITIRHFKRIEYLEIDLVDPVTESPRDFVVLVGQNGAGKSTVLQAIAAALGTLTRRLPAPSRLEWQGFSLPLAGRSWPSPPQIELEVEFSKVELAHAAAMLAEIDPETPVPPSSPNVRVLMEGNHVTCEPKEAKWQFLSRQFASELATTSGAHLFQKAGYVYWYEDHRNLGSIDPGSEQKEPIDTLRKRLTLWQMFHERLARGEQPLRPDERDLYDRFQEMYRAVFPSRTLVGTTPDTRVGQTWNEPLFLLHDGQRQYELSEISGAERAVFPILFDFLNFEVHRSIVLIDEFELHLHPPIQQALVRALRVLGRENQFIVTTHSDSVVNVLPPEHVVWLRG